jgi:hypothetical protein
VITALEMASRTPRPDAKPAAHSDRGCQYGSHEDFLNTHFKVWNILGKPVALDAQFAQSQIAASVGLSY